MAKGPFLFKQFAVAHDKCAMKVNTDGVLLGAWADVSRATRILDIGTGTGVIALMMAQKNATASIDAIDIDESACEQAKENFSQSPWADRLHVHHCKLQKYTASPKYGLIISNPPYFVDDYKTEDHQKNIAKHSVSLTYKELLSGIQSLLSDNGAAFLVLPVFNVPLLESLAVGEGLYISHLTEVTAVKGKAPYLALIELSRIPGSGIKTSLLIQQADGCFTEEYKSLTRDFYLKF